MSYPNPNQNQYPPKYQPTPYPQPPQGSNVGRVIIAVLAVLAIFCCLCCSGIFALYKVGEGMVVSEVQSAIEQAPEMQEEIGDIDSMSVNYGKSFDEDDYDVDVFDVEGSRGSGYVRVKHVADANDEEQVIWAELHLEDGRTIPLTLESGSSEFPRIPGMPNIPTPNIPTPNLPGSGFRPPNFPDPSFPEPDFPSPNIPNIPNLPNIERPDFMNPGPTFPRPSLPTPRGPRRLQ